MRSRMASNPMTAPLMFSSLVIRLGRGIRGYRNTNNPQRKIDPGPRFPWQRLYRLGFGAWYDEETVIRYWEQFNDQMPTTLQLQDALHTYGYGIELSGEADEQSRNVVRAFQMHFMPWGVSGTFDEKSAAVLFALIEKYRESELDRLLQAVTE